MENDLFFLGDADPQDATDTTDSIIIDDGSTDTEAATELTDTATESVRDDGVIVIDDGPAAVDGREKYAPSAPQSIDDRILDQVEREHIEGIKDGTIDIKVNSADDLEYMGLEQMYRRAQQPDKVGKWLSDVLSGRENDLALQGAVSRARNRYEGAWGYNSDGDSVPKSVETVQLHDSAWVGASKAALQGMTLNFADDIDAWVRSDSPEDKERILDNWQRDLDNIQGSNPAIAFTAMAAGAVAVSIATAGAGTGAMVSGRAALGLQAANTARSATAIGRAGQGIANASKIATLGATENVAAGIGDRRGTLEERTKMDDVLSDAAYGAAFGVGAYAGFRIGGKGIAHTGETIRTVINAITPARVDIGNFSNKVQLGMEKLLERAGVDKAELSANMLQRVKEADGDVSKIPSLLTEITRAAKDPNKLDDFLNGVENYGLATGDIDQLRLVLNQNIQALSEEAVHVSQIAARNISNGNITTAITELRRRIDVTGQSPEQIAKAVKEVGDLLPTATKRRFLKDLGPNYETVTDPTKLQGYINQVSRERKAVGDAIGKAYRAMPVTGTTLDDVNTVLDRMVRNVVKKGDVTPDTNFMIESLNAALNRQGSVGGARSIWKIEANNVKGQKLYQYVDVQPLGDSHEGFMQFVLDNAPDIAERFGIQSKDGLISQTAVGKTRLTADDYLRLKELGTPELNRLSAFSGLEGANIDPPTLKASNLREAMDSLAKEYKDGNLGITADDTNNIGDAFKSIFAANSPELKALNEDFSRAASFQRLSGTDGESSFLLKVLTQREPITLVDKDLAKVTPLGAAMAIKHVLSDKKLVDYMFDKTKLTESENEIAEAMLNRIGELRAIFGKDGFNKDAFVESMKKVRGQLNSNLALSDKLLDELNAPNLKSALSDARKFPDRIVRGDVSGENVAIEGEKILLDAASANKTTDELIKALDASGLDKSSPELKAAIDTLKQRAASGAEGFDTLLEDVTLDTFYKAINGFELGDVVASSKALLDIMNAPSFKEFVEYRIASVGNDLTGTKLIDEYGIGPDSAAKFIADTKEAIDVTTQLGTAIAKLNKFEGDIGAADVSSWGPLFDSVSLIFRARGGSLATQSGVLYASGELLRLSVRAVGAGNKPLLNSKEASTLMAALSGPPANNQKAMTAFLRFIGAKPPAMSLDTFLSSDKALQGMVGLSLAWEYG